MNLSLPAPALAPRLIGCSIQFGAVSGTIVETEAYQGEEDDACHARSGRTQRSIGLYGKPGSLYIYLTYGIHELLNIVCDQEGTPAAVLIRAIHITKGEAIARQRTGKALAKLELLANGPGKLTKAMGLTREYHGTMIGASVKLTDRIEAPTIDTGPRVGIGFAREPWKSKPWRFWQAGYPVVRHR